jgi:F420-non-reducing hydrogenase iron-sulfur subunit
MQEREELYPKILVFSTDKISDPGIDLAGLLKIHYPPGACAISVPCSSSIKPRWIIHALKNGFDGVFIAADGTDCPYSANCTTLTANIVAKTQEMMKEEDINPARIKMAAICSVCAEPFARHMESFSKSLIELDNAKS